MLNLTFDLQVDGCLKVLLVGAHPDDIEIGCGGTVLRLIERYPDIEFKWVVLSGSSRRAAEARNSAEAFLGKTRHSVVVERFKDGFLPYCGAEVKEFFESLKSFEPDLIMTHCRGDLHQDHRLACELTWNTFREHLILEYEIPKYDGDLGTPNLYVPLEENQATKKIDLLFTYFPSQQNKHWFRKETLLGLMRLRGMECRASGYAEGFYGRKLVMK